MNLYRFYCWICLVGLAAPTLIAQTPYPSPSGRELLFELQAVKQQLARAEKRLADWAQLGRYSQENRELRAPSSKEPRVVFVGDSITDFWDDYGYGGFFPGKSYINRGISGQTTPQMLIRFRQDVIELRPGVVVIQAGTNDIAGNTGPMTLEMTQGNLASMVELAQGNHIAVVLATLLPVSNYEKDHDGKPQIQTAKRPPEKIKALNDWIRSYSRTHNCILLDYYPAMVDEQGMLKNELSDDGLHANAAGYTVMTHLAEKAIKEALRKKRP